MVRRVRYGRIRDTPGLAEEPVRLAAREAGSFIIPGRRQGKPGWADNTVQGQTGWSEIMLEEGRELVSPSVIHC